MGCCQFQLTFTIRFVRENLRDTNAEDVTSVKTKAPLYLPR